VGEQPGEGAGLRARHVREQSAELATQQGIGRGEDLPAGGGQGQRLPALAAGSALLVATVVLWASR
jgi:hypothetical protein